MRLRRLREAPFLIDSLPYRLDGDAWRLSIVCKATYSLHEGQCAFASNPIDIFVDEQYLDPFGPLYAPRDLLPAKAHPEVIVVWPASEEARMSVEGASFPLRHPAKKTNGQALMSLVQLTSQPLGDFDAEQYQFAAREQWLDTLPIGAPFTLHHAHPQVRELTTRLPPHQPIVRVESVNAASFAVPLRADLLWLDVERELLTVTWRGQLHHDFDEALVLALGVNDGVRAAWPDASTPQGPLPQNGQSQSMETTVRVHLDEALRGDSTRNADVGQGEATRTRGKATTHSMIAVQPPRRGTFPGITALPDGMPKWLDHKPLPRPSSPPPRDGGRPPSLSPPLPPPPPPRRSESSAPSARPPESPRPPPPSPRPPTPSPSWAPTSFPPPTSLGEPVRMTPPRTPDSLGVPPPFHARAVTPPNPARALIEARHEAPQPSRAEEEKRRVGEPPAETADPLALDLLWTSEDCISHIRNHRELEKFLPPTPAPPPPPAPILGNFDWEPSSPPRGEADDQVIRRALRDADATALLELRERLLGFARDETQPDLVVVMVKGELVISYDQRAALKIMTDTARPLADPKSRELFVAVENVERVIDTPLAEDPGILKSVTDQLLGAWKSKARDLPKDFLAEHTRRLLVKQRQYQKQRVLGDMCVRAFFRHGAEEVPVYLPAAAEARLPSMLGFEARVIAKIVPRQDEVEACRVALVPLAVARRIDDAATE